MGKKYGICHDGTYYHILIQSKYTEMLLNNTDYRVTKIKSKILNRGRKPIFSNCVIHIIIIHWYNVGVGNTFCILPFVHITNSPYIRLKGFFFHKPDLNSLKILTRLYIIPAAYVLLFWNVQRSMFVLYIIVKVDTYGLPDLSTGPKVIVSHRIYIYIYI